MKNVEVRNLSVIYNKKTSFEKLALKKVDLEIKKNEILLICGKTGSGKSTFIKCLNLLIKDFEGEVFFNGSSIKKENIKKVRRSVGVVFQYPSQQIFETDVKRELIYAPLNFGFSKKEALKSAKKACEKIGFNYEKYKNKSPFELSGGEKRKVAIASILSYEPDVLIFDEPTAGLDLSGKENLKNVLLDLKKEKTIIIITHDTDFCYDIADKIAVFFDGEVKYFGNPFKLFFEYEDEFFEKYGVKIPVYMKIARKLNIKKEKDFFYLKEEIKCRAL
jgi:energy-coupling factor transport system ATP-binding protein